VRLAAARVLEAQARLGITRADQYPIVSAEVAGLGQRTAQALGFPSRTIGAVQLQGSAAWQLDFWGRYRRATEAARAELLAAQWGRRAVVASVVADVATGYFRLRMLDLSLDVSRQTLESREESLRLTQVRERGGVTSLVDVRQAEQLVYDARAEIVTLERQIEQQENALSVLAGDNPGPIARGQSLVEQAQPPALPAGLPSSLLERRPDVEAAEQQLVAANAQIGVARSAYFPSIGLTGSGGVQSTALSALLSGANVIWAAAASLTQPVFTAGRTRSEVAVATAQREQSLLLYQETVRQAFRTCPTRWSGIGSWESTGRSRRCCWPRPTTRGASPTCAIAAAPPAIWRCWTRIRGDSTPSSGSPMRSSRRWRAGQRLPRAGRRLDARTTASRVPLTPISTRRRRPGRSATA
jgi:multidrug efflux system outer membrane protein